MSHVVSSRAATHSLTLADVLDSLAEIDLPDRRRQELRSAARSTARALGRAPEQIPADPRLLRARLADVAPRALGLSPGRWSNIRSLIRAALNVTTDVAPGRLLTSLSPAWKALWDQQISRFLRFCSAAEIGPEDVTENTFTIFRDTSTQRCSRIPLNRVARH